MAGKEKLLSRQKHLHANSFFLLSIYQIVTESFLNVVDYDNDSPILFLSQWLQPLDDDGDHRVREINVINITTHT